MSKKTHTVDFTNVKNYWEMHAIIYQSLDFPDYYGCNWSAFWDCLKDMYGELTHIEIIGLEVIEQKFGDSAEKMIKILRRWKHYANDRFSDSIRIEIVSGTKRTLIE